ncbi:hypothetical protein Glove_501g1 [Diversispora epigaea]|uniref:Protein kinase domain-containing protein n=1 Tax=Diversispora epigaea TaxID=1348612 RepID=A0A397GH40_9GLOM|nr:hypothetical protein Glove_501g1 [Diversispora epigaea]
MEIHLKTRKADSLQLQLYGITQDPKTLEYIMVLQYMDGGNYLKNNFNNIVGERKLSYFELLTMDFNDIHKLDIIYHDFHPGNILLTTYELATGFAPYYDIPHDKNLICNELRPKITFHIPKLITKLIMRCWDARVNH